MKSILQDDRPTATLYQPDDVTVTVGKQGVEKIEAYCEVNDVVWFAVWRNGAITSRVNSAYVDTVVYAKEPDDGNT